MCPSNAGISIPQGAVSSDRQYSVPVSLSKCSVSPSGSENPTRPVSRSTHPAFDWENPATWRTAIEGTDTAYVTYQPDLAVPGAASTIKAFVRVAAEAGMKHIVLLSGRGEKGAERAEDILKTSGLAWNIVRASWFCQNFSESFMREDILAGELVLPAGDTVEPNPVTVTNCSKSPAHAR